MNILINNIFLYLKECMGMKLLYNFCENCVVYDLREILIGKIYNKGN